MLYRFWVCICQNQGDLFSWKKKNKTHSGRCQRGHRRAPCWVKGVASLVGVRSQRPRWRWSFKYLNMLEIALRSCYGHTLYAQASYVMVLACDLTRFERKMYIYAPPMSCLMHIHVLPHAYLCSVHLLHHLCWEWRGGCGYSLSGRMVWFCLEKARFLPSHLECFKIQ